LARMCHTESGRYGDRGSPDVNASTAVTTSGNAGAMQWGTFTLQSDSGGGMVSIELQPGGCAWSCKRPAILLQEPPGKRQHPRAVARACHRTEPALRTCR